MPKKGYKTVTIPEATLNRLTQLAEALNKSIPETILYLAEQKEANRHD